MKWHGFWMRPSGSMKTIIKWPGGKERELPVILDNIPFFSGRYVEPFAGGAALFWALKSAGPCCLNDRSEDLILLYRCVRDADPGFAALLKAECDCFAALGIFAEREKDLLLRYYSGESTDKELLGRLSAMPRDTLFSGLPSAGGEAFAQLYLHHAGRSLENRRKRASVSERRRGTLSEADRHANMESALKAALYNALREELNCPQELQGGQRAAVFWFIRELCYSSMFRYNSKGAFNVPYGGISYNSKDLGKKAGRLVSEEVRGRLCGTQISCGDFEAFLDGLLLTEEDFVFADPPYDSDFSEYAGNRFGREEHKRLCAYLERTPAKVMAVIKNTPFVYDLYRGSFRIRSFEKKYLVSFKNRNERAAEHLLITNY